MYDEYEDCDLLIDVHVHVLLSSWLFMSLDVDI